MPKIEAQDHGSPPVKPHKQSPIVQGVPIVGILPQLLRNPLAELTRLTRVHAGEIPILHFGPNRLHLLTHPDHIAYVLQEKWRVFSRRNELWKPVEQLSGSDGLFFSDDARWLTRRRMLQPVFTRAHLSTLCEILVEAASRRAHLLESVAARGETIDVLEEMRQTIVPMVLTALFSFDGHERQALRAVHALERALGIVGTRILLSGLPAWTPILSDAALQKEIDVVDEFILTLIRERRARGEQRRDLLSALMQARDEQTGEALDEQQICKELVTLFIGSSDTLVPTMTWMLCLLSQFPGVEARVRGELTSVLDGRAPTFEDLARLSYTDRVIQETMRLFPAVFMMPRVALQEETIDGYHIPAGSIVVMVPYATHRDPEQWSQPESFDPDRFLPERSAGRHEYAYIPFGGGPRRCIGSLLAMMEAKIILSQFLPRFRARLVSGHPGLELRMRGNLKPHPSPRMVLTPLAA